LDSSGAASSFAIAGAAALAQAARAGGCAELRFLAARGDHERGGREPHRDCNGAARGRKGEAQTFC